MKHEAKYAILDQIKNIHFIGIGGVSMSSLAQILFKRGYAVSGSDRSSSAVLDNMSMMGIRIDHGHDAENVGMAQAVVYTAAIPDGNPELCEARKRGIPIFTRAELLGWLMLDYRLRIGVAGTHGKSTTTSMLAMILMKADVNPTVLSGADLAAMGGSYRIGGDEYFLFEACEYKDSFLSFCPTTAIIGNVELDHTDYFPSLAAMERSFSTYLRGSEIAVINANDEAAMRTGKDYDGRIVTFGIDADAAYRAERITYNGLRCYFVLSVRGEKKGSISLSVPGRHNVLNALAACAAAMENGISFEDVSAGLALFAGAGRRFDFAGMLNGAPVYDDYAHHPSEIRATLEAAKAMDRRVVCVFQPHTFSRTHELFDDFVRALSAADLLCIAEIFAAREENRWNVSSSKLAAAIDGAICLSDFDAIASWLMREVRENDLVLIMGAGDVNRLTRMLNLTSKCE